MKDRYSDVSLIQLFAIQIPTVLVDQIWAKLGTDSRFVLEANLKSLYPRSSRSSIVKAQNRDQSTHNYKPGAKSLEYHRSYMKTDSCNNLFLNQNPVKAEF